MDEFGIRLLCPAARAQIDLIRKGAYGNRDGNALHVEVPSFAPILPIETSARKRRVRQPGDRDVVEDIVPGEAGSFSGKDARDKLVAARIVIKEISRQADGRVRDSIQCLRPQPHLEPVGDSLLIYELQTLVSDLLVG